MITGAVAAGSPLAARAGADALAAGGTAVDAVIAGSLMSAVSESVLTGPGAGGFLLVRPPGGPATLLDFFVAAPGLGPNGRPLDPADLHAFTVLFGGAEQVFHIGAASCAVPGMLAGLDLASRRYGRLPLAELAGPAVRQARDGVMVSEQVAYLHHILAEMLRHTPSSAAMYAQHGGAPTPAGATICMPDLANSLERFGREGAACLYDGPLGEEMIRYLKVVGGHLTREDLRAYGVIERVPLEVAFRGVTVLTNPPPSSGGMLIAAALAHLASRPAAQDDVGYYVGLAAAGERSNDLRGPEFDSGLSDDDFLERFWAAFAAQQTSGDPPSRKPTGTTHVSAIDAEGGSASLSSSNGSGSGIVVPGTGIMLNNMMGEADLNPGGFGTVPAGVRMTSMMAPTIIIDGDHPVAALGSAGSNRLRSAILAVVVGMVDSGGDLAAAVARPRVHHEGGGVDVEGGVPQAAISALRDAGFDLRLWTEANLYFGGVSAVGVTEHGLTAAGDPRRGGGAFGVDEHGEVFEL